MSDSERSCLYWRAEYPSVDIYYWLAQEQWIYCLYSWPEGSLILHCMSLMVACFTQSWTPHSFRGFVETCCHCLLVCLNMLWLKTTAWGEKADGMWLDSVSGMEKLAGTFTSHNFGRAKGTYQSWDLHRTHRHPRLKLWSCSAVQILLNCISIFQFKVFQIHWVTPQFMHSPAQVLADGNKTVSILQHWQNYKIWLDLVVCVVCKLRVLSNAKTFHNVAKK